MRFISTLFAAATMALAPAAQAAVVVVANYSMRNGDGQAHGGSYNYWDRSYTGAGSTTTDGSALSGGKGDLTDGVIATAPWSSVENSAGTGPYVGWLRSAGANPIVTFNFLGAPTITSIQIALDNSQGGGVVQPMAIWVDGAAATYTPLAAGTVGTVTISGLNLTGPSHTLQFFHNTSFDSWVFVSEVTFNDNASSGVPEPATWALMIGGFGAVGGAMRRRRPALA